MTIFFQFSIREKKSSGDKSPLIVATLSIIGGFSYRKRFRGAPEAVVTSSFAVEGVGPGYIAA
jgi:hypothetical protein